MVIPSYRWAGDKPPRILPVLRRERKLRHYVISARSAFAAGWGLTNRMIDGMLLGIRKNLGARSLLVALLACAPLLAISGTAHAAQTPALRVSPARVANPSPHAIPSYRPSKHKTPTLPSPRGGGSLPRAHPLV